MPKRKLAPTEVLKREIDRLDDLVKGRGILLEQAERRNQELRQALAKRTADAQLVSRERLAASLAQLMEACAHAIQYTVAKESI